MAPAIYLKIMAKYYFSAPLLLPWRRAHLRRHSTFQTVHQTIFWVKDSASQKFQILKAVSTLTAKEKENIVKLRLRLNADIHN